MDRRYTSRNEIGQGVLELKPQEGEWAVYPRHNMREFVVLGAAIDRLAAYEDTGLTPDEVNAMKAEYSDTFQAHLNQMCNIKDKQIDVLQALCEDMENTAKEYRAFKEYFDKLYGRNLTVGNWHLNGNLEPFDNFYDKAVDEMRRERNNADSPDNT